ncbi:MAG: hypothetical protein O2888_04995, partial [Chloroflexi bacterium]|nr:hypothetical protein [Chloroflexota bacterium]
MIDGQTRQTLRTRLDASRAALLASLADATERDFATSIGAETVVQLLARLALQESRVASEALGEVYATRHVERPMPPQVIHALAGARYRTLRYIESEEANEATAAALVDATEAQERDAAARIAARPPLPPL